MSGAMADHVPVRNTLRALCPDCLRADPDRIRQAIHDTEFAHRAIPPSLRGMADGDQRAAFRGALKYTRIGRIDCALTAMLHVRCLLDLGDPRLRQGAATVAAGLCSELHG